MTQMADKVAIVTGGGSGMGRASSVLFAQEGAAVAVADLNEDGGQQTVAMIEQAGGRACGRDVCWHCTDHDRAAGDCLRAT